MRPFGGQTGTRREKCRGIKPGATVAAVAQPPALDQAAGVPPKPGERHGAALCGRLGGRQRRKKTSARGGLLWPPGQARQRRKKLARVRKWQVSPGLGGGGTPSTLRPEPRLQPFFIGAPSAQAPVRRRRGDAIKVCFARQRFSASWRNTVGLRQRRIGRARVSEKIQQGRSADTQRCAVADGPKSEKMVWPRRKLTVCGLVAMHDYGPHPGDNWWQESKIARRPEGRDARVIEHYDAMERETRGARGR